MALYALRLRRALTLSSSLVHHSLRCPAPSLLLPTARLISQNPTTSLKPPFPRPASFRFFTSATTSLSARGRAFDENTDEIGPDTILFEGCDYNHWLIVVDFPKDPEPSRDEMIRFYEETAAKVFGSLEEAKKNIYACSTTTYKGFQVLCSEETSEKFQGLPGVIFVLPDSYIDPVNKEYGGDKYINGEIIPRPPPVQYGRQGPRRDFRSRPSPRGGMQSDSRNFAPPQRTPPQQNFGQPPPQQNFGQPPPQQNFGQPPPQQNFGQPPPRPNFGQPPPPQQNYGQPPPPQQNYGQPPPPQQNYGVPQNFPPQQNYGPPGRGPTPASNVPGGWDNTQGGRRDPVPSYQPNYNQGDGGNFYPQGQRNSSYGDHRSYPPPDNRSFPGPAPQGGNFGQAPGGAQGQQTADQRNMMQGVDQRNSAAMGNASTDQGRY